MSAGTRSRAKKTADGGGAGAPMGTGPENNHEENMVSARFYFMYILLF
jgi:hypothetical protein